MWFRSSMFPLPFKLPETQGTLLRAKSVHESIKAFAWGLTNILLAMAFFTITLFVLPGHAAERFSSLNEAAINATSLIDQNNYPEAVTLLAQAHVAYPDSGLISVLYAEALLKNGNPGLALVVLNKSDKIRTSEKAKALLTEINERFEKFTKSSKMAIVVIQKENDAGNFETAIAVAEKAIEKFPDDEVLFTSYGRSLLEVFRLEESEQALRKALQINPKNLEARKLIEEIRATSQAQTSTEVAEWISIAKDKVGDFIVTFLALFAAFITNSLVSPIVLRIKLNRARKAVEQGNYDDFTDLLEGLLDEENFAPLRANFRFLLKEKSYEEAQDILNRYVNTLERLPTLLRILERENDKIKAST